jgi:hypothetical protein
MKIITLPCDPQAGVPFYRQTQIMRYLASKGHTIVEMPLMDNLKKNKDFRREFRKQLQDADFLYLISPVSPILQEAIACIIKDNMNEVMIKASGCPIKDIREAGLSTKDLRIIVDFDDEPVITMAGTDDYFHRGRKDVYLNNADGSVTPVWEKGKNYANAGEAPKIFNPLTNYMNIKSRIEILKLAAVFTSPSELLLRGFGRFNKAQSLLLVHNAMDFTKIPAYKHSTDGKLRILWGMGSSHIMDFQEMAPAIAALMAGDPRVILVTCGQRFDHPLIPLDRREHHDWVAGVENYYKNFANITADIGLAYVTNNRFNRCKSPVKVEEYMAARLPVIMSRTLYGNTIGNSKVLGVLEAPMDLVSIVASYAHTDLDALTDFAYEYVKDEFNLDRVGEYVEVELLELTKKPLYPLMEQKMKNLAFRYTAKIV